MLAFVPCRQCHTPVFEQHGYFALLMAVHYFGSVYRTVTACYVQTETALQTNRKLRHFSSFVYTLNHDDKLQDCLLGLFQGNKVQIHVFLLGCIIIM